MTHRIGNGFDVHAFGTGDSIIMGGVVIPHSHGIKAHSDGDVLIHALCDALLGAAALGDIGHFFPDTDAAFENADSRVLLRKVVELIKDKGFSIGNADNTILTQAPKLASYIEAVRANLADDLAVPIDRVSVKATTSERLGFVGREEGIAVYSVALLTAGDNPC